MYEIRKGRKCIKSGKEGNVSTIEVISKQNVKLLKGNKRYITHVNLSYNAVWTMDSTSDSNK